VAKTLIQQSRRTSSVAKATYHELTGAGRSRVKRPFFGLNPDDETAIYKRIDDELQQHIDRNR
jgi:phage gpG-like protein